ncbi:MAG: tetratricopeptide repeat protein [Acidobacteria bacterium]|nr:MAG: tetratricopeptide repeat protein [Acidobacteriota bacterium]
MCTPSTARPTSTAQAQGWSMASKFFLTFFTPEVPMSRIEILKGFLKENATDSFSRYALALEYVKLGQNDDAVREFEKVQKNDPGYVATYYQLGQLYQKLGKRHEAEKTFRTGISVASKASDDHTRSELEAALETLLAS